MKLRLKFNFSQKIISPRNLNVDNKSNKFKDLNRLALSSENMKLIIKNKIQQSGPISISEYMDTCLYHKDYGYYTTKEHIFGTSGDFVTAPEVSQMFGSCIGVFINKILEEFGNPKEFELLEIGAGRGFLMLDVIMSLFLTNTLKGADITVIEKSPKLKKIQQENINNLLLKKKIFTKYQYDEVIFI